MNGMELAMEVSKLAPAIPMALVTANIQEKVRLRAEAMGLTFIEKPITEERLAPLLAQLEGAP